MQFTTQRLVLREWEERDLPALHAVASDLETMRYMTGRTYSLEESRAKLQQRLARAAETPRRLYVMAVTLRDDEGQAIGRSGLYVNADDRRIAYIGYDLQRQYWGNGYIVEATAALMQFGFADLNLHRIYAECHPENTGSRRVMEKLGMRYEGHLRECHWENGEWWDVLVYAILDHEYHAS